MKTLKAIGITILVIAVFIALAIGIVALPNFIKIVIALVAFTTLIIGAYLIIRDAVDK